MKKKKIEERWLAIDQYGQIHGPVCTAHPRKALLDMFGESRARKMYVDKTDGSTVHIGYIIAGLWLTLFKLTPMERKV